MAPRCKLSKAVRAKVSRFAAFIDSVNSGGTSGISSEFRTGAEQFPAATCSTIGAPEFKSAWLDPSALDGLDEEEDEPVADAKQFPAANCRDAWMPSRNA